MNTDEWQCLLSVYFPMFSKEVTGHRFLVFIMQLNYIFEYFFLALLDASAFLCSRYSVSGRLPPVAICMSTEAAPLATPAADGQEKVT